MDSHEEEHDVTKPEHTRAGPPLAGPSPSESDDEHDTQALPGIECVDSHEEEHDDTKPQHTRARPLPWLPLLLVGLLVILYAALLQ